jgi:glycosyltransferase involved in cell wall biosynthesis
MSRFLLNRIGVNARQSFSEFVSGVSSFGRLRTTPGPKILEIGNYPPPQCGWAIQTKLLTEELRRNGAACTVLNINESRKIKSPEYVDVQSGPDYLLKLLGFALRGYRPHAHVNAQSWEGYVLTMTANLVARAVGRPAVMTFHGGDSQRFFPRPDSYFLTLAYRLLFLSAGSITCDSIEIERAIKSYGTARRPVFSVPCFSRQNLAFQTQVLASEVEAFLQSRTPVFFCFLCFRPEYAIDSLLAGMHQFSQQYPRAGFIWLGFPAKEMPALHSLLNSLPNGKPENLLVLGNLDHDSFLTLLSRCFAYLRPHYRDGVSASVLESITMGIPVIAAENGMRPSGVVSYDWRDPNDLCSKLVHVVQNYDQVKAGLEPQGLDDNIERVVQWLLMTERKGVKELIDATPGQGINQFQLQRTA